MRVPTSPYGFGDPLEEMKQRQDEFARKKAESDAVFAKADRLLTEKNVKRGAFAVAGCWLAALAVSLAGSAFALWAVWQGVQYLKRH